MRRLSLLFGAALTLAAPAAAQNYTITHTYKLGGDGGWDYLALDTAGHRLFIARQDRVMVVDPENGKPIAVICRHSSALASFIDRWRRSTSNRPRAVTRSPSLA